MISVSPSNLHSSCSRHCKRNQYLGIMATDPLSELQDDLNLDDTNQSLSQLKLTSIDNKNWPADESPAFPKSGEYPACLGSGFCPKRNCLSCSTVIISTYTESLSSI